MLELYKTTGGGAHLSLHAINLQNLKKYCQILILLCCSTPSFAQTVTKTLLWEVRKPGNTNVSYLFGTFHYVSTKFFDALAIANSKLAQSDILYVERAKQVSDESATSLKNEKWNPAKWKSYLSQAQDSIFKKFTSKSEDTSLYYYAPLAVSLNVHALYTKYFCEDDYSSLELMDHHIESVARKTNKKVFSLDTRQDDIIHAASNANSYSQDSLLIAGCIRYMSNMLDENLEDCDIISKYKKFDIDYDFETDFTKSKSPSVLLIERNNLWINILKKSFVKNNCFVAVGLRHLFYQQGLIQQLRKLGFTVEPVFV
ncbi:MAG: TraB/GumN family protein [Bacteroidetes bacterium]|nr:MAG: TraB/GumN family protein [Bacteroidota bacterium]